MFGVLVFGDSIAFGRGETPNIGWAGRLKAHVEKQGFHHCVFTLGIPGDTSQDLLERFEVEARARARYRREGDAFVILFAVGMNDAKAVDNPGNIKVTIKSFEKNIISLLEKARAITPEIALIGLAPIDETRAASFENTFFSNERIKRYDAVLERQAEKAGVVYVPLFKRLGEDWKRSLSDGVHPSATSYRKMYGLILKELRERKLIE